MKKNLMTLVLALFAWTGMSAMDYETARERAYYLTDKMAYELNLNDQQYNDAYEINLDYLLSLNTEADLADVRYLTYRNDDLRHILYDWQWTAFAAVDYLFRPVWWLNGGWYFPVFRYYTHGYYFYHRPSIFWDYRGGHGRFYFSHGFYHNRRPMWHGGLRGMHSTMIGHPNGSRGGRYGEPGGGRGGFRPEGRGGNSGRSYHFDGNRLSTRNPGAGNTRSGRGGMDNMERSNGSRSFEPGQNSSSRTTVTRPDRGTTRGGITSDRSAYDRTSRGTTMGSGRSGLTTPSRSTVTSSSRSSSFSSGSSRGTSNFGGSRSTGSSFGGSRSTGSSFSGSRGSSMSSSRGSMGGSRSTGGSSRGGGRR